MEIFQGAQLAEVAAKDSSQALFAMLNQLPLGTLTSILATVLVFFVTSGDSATLVLASMSEDGHSHPSNRSKSIWGVLVAGIALAGGLKAVQTATIMFALPFSLVLMAVALIRAVKHDWEEEQRQQRELQRQLHKMVH